MVLGQGIEDAAGKRYAMAGLLQLETSFARRSLHLGYRRARLRADSVLGAAGGETLVDCQDAAGAAVPEAGARRGTVSGTFFHAICMGRS